MRSQCQRDGTAAEHAPADPATHPRKAQPALNPRGFLLVAALSGCGAGAALPPAGPEPVLAPEAIRAGTTGLEIGFGRARDGAVDAVARLVGAEPAARTALVCEGQRTEAVIWDEGLTIYFAGIGLAGWRAIDTQGRTWRSTGGLATGAPAGDASQRGIRAEIGPDGRIAALSAGLACPA